MRRAAVASHRRADGELHVHQALDVQLAGQLARLAFDLLDHAGRQAVRRDDAGRVARVDAGLLDVLHDAADERARAVAEAIDVHLDGRLQELVDQDRLARRHLHGLARRSGVRAVSS